MRLDKLSKTEVKAIESNLDAQFEATPLPTSDLNTARWLVCLINEDLSRFALLEIAKSWHLPDARPLQTAFVHRLDHYKYALRHALELCAKRLPKTEVCGPIPTTEKNYTSAAHLHEAAGEFADATRIFSSFYANSIDLFVNHKTGMVQPSRDYRTSQYGSLEFLLLADVEEVSPILYIMALFGGPAYEIPAIESTTIWPREIHQIVNAVRLKQGRLKYQLITNFARHLYEHFNVRPSWAPPNWVFPWSSMPEAQRYFAALQTISAYNLISIHFGGERNSLEGCGIDQICLGVDACKLNSDIERISGLRADVVAATTRALTLGSGTETPDPALQPLVPIGCNRFAVPGTVVLSSNWLRNMLALHARVDEESFNRGSSVFEHSMIPTLTARLPLRFPCYTSVYVPTFYEAEEVDLILIDEQAGSILFGELRWMLQPGDVREVLNRKKAIKDKVSQARRKVAGARAALPKVLKKLGLPPGSWKINGVVIIEGFGGSPSDDPKVIPVIPHDVFVEIVARCPNLEHAHAAMCTSLWLPRDGIDFRSTWERVTICGIPFNRPGLGAGPKSYMKTSLGEYLAEAFGNAVEDLRAMSWEADELCKPGKGLDGSS